jgi:TNF receptor-associated protein 1
MPEVKVTGTPVKHEFKAETKKLLNIVANSLYSEKEVQSTGFRRSKAL